MPAFAFLDASGSLASGRLDRLGTDHPGILLERAAAMLDTLPGAASYDVAIVRADLSDDVCDEHALGVGALFKGRRVHHARLRAVLEFLGVSPDAVGNLNEHGAHISWAAYQRAGLEPDYLGVAVGLALGAALLNASRVRQDPELLVSQPQSGKTALPCMASSPSPAGRRAGKWLSINDVAREYGLNRSAVYRLPVRYFTPVGKRRRYLRADIEAHLRATVHPAAALSLESVAPRSSPAHADEGADLESEWNRLADDLGL